jgi:HK97 family phage portal protein
MRLWPFHRKAQSQLASVDSRHSWWHTVYESFTGAWQKNIEVKRECVLAYWAVYSCIKLITGDISKMRVKLVEMGENGLWTEVMKSPFLPVLRKPNHYQTRLQFFSYWVTSLLVSGNTYVMKVRDGRGIVVAMYVLDPCHVKVLVADDGSVFYQLRGDNLGGRGEILDVTVPASEIIHDRMMCIFHPLVGVSPIFACGVAATQGLAIQENSANFFLNGAMPGGIITVPGALNKDQADVIKEMWNTNYGGKNRGKTAVLADKMEYKPMTINAVDSQVVEQLEMTAKMVCSTFNVPAYKAGVGDPPSDTSVAELNQQYYDQCLQTIIEGIESTLDEGLGLTAVPGKTLGVEFDLSALIRMDPAAQMEFVEKGVKASVLAPDEGRRMFDLQPVPGGASPMAQQQNFSLAALAKRDALADPFAKSQTETPPALPAPEDSGADDANEEVARALAAILEKELADVSYE